MFKVRLQEVSLPTSDRDIDSLTTWFIDTLCLVRKRGDEMADHGFANPVHRLLRDYLFAQPEVGWDAQMLADELALTPASLNHHLARLVQSGIIGYTNEGKGWRRYYLRGGSLSKAVEIFSNQASIIVNQRLELIDSRWGRENPRLPLELPENDRPPLTLGVVDHRPIAPESEENIVSQWMGDFGLLGERPGKEIKADSISVRLFELLLSRDAPLSLDEAVEILGGQKARIGRILERFRSSGMVERIPRTDRLSVALWNAMTAQHQRRGEDWMLKKGGFQRILNEKQQSKLLMSLKKGKLSIEDVAAEMKSIEPQQQMLLLNLLGGRLPLGHRMNGEDAAQVRRNVQDSLDRVLRRMRRVAEMLESELSANSSQLLKNNVFEHKLMSEFIGQKFGKWEGEERPLFLAPMSGVTDLPFRLLAKECGADVTITEFTNSTALSRAATASWRKMESHETEVPFIPQIFGGDAKDMVTAAEMLAPNCDVIDLNFGCPAPKVTKICAGAALMGEPDNLVSMVTDIVESVDVPVTAKMRLGTGASTHNAVEICRRLEKVGAQRLCVHGRTLRQRYSGVADWDYIKQVVESVEVPVIANGDVTDSESAAKCLEKTNASG